MIKLGTNIRVSRRGAGRFVFVFLLPVFLRLVKKYIFYVPYYIQYIVGYKLHEEHAQSAAEMTFYYMLTSWIRKDINKSFWKKQFSRLTLLFPAQNLIQALMEVSESGHQSETSITSNGTLSSAPFLLFRFHWSYLSGPAHSIHITSTKMQVCAR